MGQQEVVPEKSVKEQIRDQKRSVDRSKRALEREKTRLEREKKKMLTQIKKLALAGQHNGAKMMARDIVRMTTQMNKLTEFIGQLSAISLRISSVNSLNELSDAMEQAGKAMTLVSSKLDTAKLAQIGKTMAKEDAKLDMKQDMMQDILDDLGGEMDDPEEQEKLYKDVLCHVGLEVDNVLPGAKNIEAEKKEKEGEEDSLDAMLKSLQK